MIPSSGETAGPWTAFRLWVHATAWAVFLFVALVFVTLVPFRNDAAWIDPVTGTMKYEKRRLIFRSTTEEPPTALERWIVQAEGKHVRNWRFLHRETSALLYAGSYASGGHFPVYPLHEDVLNTSFVRRSTDAELARFVRTMRSGTPDEMQAAVDAALVKAVEGPESARGKSAASPP
jgi:hypothetical protein